MGRDDDDRGAPLLEIGSEEEPVGPVGPLGPEHTGELESEVRCI